MGFVIWDLGFGIQDSGFGISECIIWIRDFGICSLVWSIVEFGILELGFRKCMCNWKLQLEFSICNPDFRIQYIGFCLRRLEYRILELGC